MNRDQVRGKTGDGILDILGSWKTVNLSLISSDKGFRETEKSHLSYNVLLMSTSIDGLSKSTREV